MPTRSLRFLALALLLSSASTIQSAEEPVIPACDRVRFRPNAGTERAMVGARIEGSNASRTGGYVTLATIERTPTAGTWNEQRFANTKLYRWLRMSMPKGEGMRIGGVEFYSGERLLGGEGRGVRFSPFVEGEDAVNEGAVGYDIFDTATTNRPSFSPATGDVEGPVELKLAGPRGAAIRYLVDGATPTATHGETYTRPIPIEKNTTVTAVAIAPDRAPSLPVTMTYLIKGQTAPGLVTAHIGNSLTGTAGGFWRFARTAGRPHQQDSFLRPGALTRELWAVATGEYRNDPLANAKETQAQQRGSQTWESYWSKIGKVDHLTLQPREFNLENEVAAEVQFIRRFREKSPDVQPWLYCEWVELKRQRPSDKGLVPSYQMTKTFPALTWEESMSAMLLYVEELQYRLRERLHEGKPARVLPTALAMGWIKNRIDHGEFPGVSPGSFYPLLFNDQVHPADSPIHGGANGAYLVDLTWYAAFYREAPERKVLPIETSFTPEQARVIERLAWDVVKNYPDCGLYEEGTQPCGTPEFIRDGKLLTLKSATPGAWFRYTLDGTTPTRTRGYVYCGAISLQPGVRPKAVAYKSGMRDSAPAEANVDF